MTVTTAGFWDQMFPSPVGKQSLTRSPVSGDKQTYLTTWGKTCFISIYACGTVGHRCQEVLVFWSSRCLWYLYLVAVWYCLSMWKWERCFWNRKLMLEAHFDFLHLSKIHGFCLYGCFVSLENRFSLSPPFSPSSIRKVFFDGLHSLFCGNKSLLFHQEKKKVSYHNDRLRQGEGRKVFWRKIILFPYFS